MTKVTFQRSVVVTLSHATHGGRSSNQPRATSSTTCQKCAFTGHFIYECKGTRPFLSRPSRTQQLENPKLLAKLKAEGKPSVEVPEEFKRPVGTANKILEAKEKERAKDEKGKGKEKEKEKEKSTSHKSKRTKRRHSNSDPDSSSKSDSDSDSSPSSSSGSSSSSDPSSGSESESSRSRERDRKRRVPR